MICTHSHALDNLCAIDHRYSNYMVIKRRNNFLSWLLGYCGAIEVMLNAFSSDCISIIKLIMIINKIKEIK